MQVATRFPDMFAINVSPLEKEHRAIWRADDGAESTEQQWIPSWLHVASVTSEAGSLQVTVTDASSDPASLIPPTPGRVGTPAESLPELLYTLVGVVYHIEDPTVKHDKSDDPHTHFVSCLKIGNDGCYVPGSPTDTVTSIDSDWKGMTALLFSSNYSRTCSWDVINYFFHPARPNRFPHAHQQLGDLQRLPDHVHLR